MRWRRQRQIRDGWMMFVRSSPERRVLRFRFNSFVTDCCCIRIVASGSIHATQKAKLGAPLCRRGSWIHKLSWLCRPTTAVDYLTFCSHTRNMRVQPHTSSMWTQTWTGLLNTSSIPKRSPYASCVMKQDKTLIFTILWETYMEITLRTHQKVANIFQFPNLVHIRR